MPALRPRFRRNDILSLTEETPRYDLAESVGPDLRLGDLLSKDEGAGLQDLALSYSGTSGNEALRTIIADSHGVGAEDVVLTIGGMQTLFLTAYILCEPGEEVVVVTPIFPNALSVLRTVGARVRELRLSFDQGYRLTPKDIRPLLSGRTRLVSLASPQNPSGVSFDLDTIKALLDLMADICPDAYLLIDETYRQAVYGTRDTQASAASLSPKVISCASLSKCHGVPGLRSGWAITQDPELREQIMLGKFETVICGSAVDEALALQVMEKQEEIISRRRPHLQAGYERTRDWVTANASLLEWVPPSAGALCCVRLRPDVVSDQQVDDFYHSLPRFDVRVAPGDWFGEDKRVFRLGFGLLSMPDLEAGLAALSEALALLMVKAE
ncbi:pyridoxal phosphate-dependent aminotransferase [Rhodovibrionaceae bacterium A322]